MTRILLVEDDEDVRPLMEHVLLTAGYEVDSAAAAAQSLCMYTMPARLMMCMFPAPPSSCGAVPRSARWAGADVGSCGPGPNRSGDP
jgi:CheY-like chemotaxis protein